MYKVGDHVLVASDDAFDSIRELTGVIQDIDEDDDYMPYNVRFEGIRGGTFWCRAEWLAPVSFLNLRPDVDELVDEILCKEGEFSA